MDLFDNKTEPDYTEYNKLSEYNKRCVLATNYWRVIEGKEIIEVPPENKRYYHYATKKYFDRAKATKWERIAKRKRHEDLNNETIGGDKHMDTKRN